MTTKDSPQANDPGAATPFIALPLRTRLRRGAGWGLLIGVLWALIEAAFADWDAGLAFNKYSPPGDPLGLTLAVVFVTPPLVGAIGGALAPLLRTRRGTVLVGVVSITPLVVGAAILATTRLSAPLWQAVVILLGLLIFAASMALDIRNDLLKTERDSDPPDPDRPHN